jgi:hypothetical protein
MTTQDSPTNTRVLYNREETRVVTGLSLHLIPLFLRGTPRELFLR